MQIERGEESGSRRLISPFVTTAWTTPDRAKPRISAHRISQPIAKAIDRADTRAFSIFSPSAHRMRSPDPRKDRECVEQPVREAGESARQDGYTHGGDDSARGELKCSTEPTKHPEPQYEAVSEYRCRKERQPQSERIEPEENYALRNRRGHRARGQDCAKHRPDAPGPAEGEGDAD